MSKGSILIYTSAAGQAAPLPGVALTVTDAGGSVRIGHCRNAAFALELCTEIRRRFPGAEVKSYPLRGLCSYYAEHGGIMLGFAS